jgi:hypothetical protein
MKRRYVSIKHVKHQQPVAGRLSHREWARSLQEFHRAEVAKWRKEKEQHKADLRQAAADAYVHTIQDVQRGLHAMLEGLPFDQKLYEAAGRVLADARDKAAKRMLDE